MKIYAIIHDITTTTKNEQKTYLFKGNDNDNFQINEIVICNTKQGATLGKIVEIIDNNQFTPKATIDKLNADSEKSLLPLELATLGYHYPKKTNFVIFEPSMAKTQQQRDTLQQVLTLCEKGPDNYLGSIGLEEATENLLRLFPEVDYIGFDSDSEYDEEYGYVRHKLKIYDKNSEEYSHIERAVCSDNKNLKIIAEQICKNRNINPKYLGGMWSYIHISQEGYTLGTHL